MRPTPWKSLASALVAASALALHAAEANAQQAIAGFNPQFPFARAQGSRPYPGAPLGNLAEWLGGDGGSLAVFPDGVTTFWAFGDTFIGPTDAQNRSLASPNVVNTIAIGLVQNNQFNPYYFYSGDNRPYQLYPNNPTNPTPFFNDPLADPDINSMTRSRFWVGKSVFYGGKLFVFLLRVVPVQGSTFPANASTMVARINNPTVDPKDWQIDYLMYSKNGNPGIVAEAIPANATDMIVYGVYNPGPNDPPGSTFKTIATKVNLPTLLYRGVGAGPKAVVDVSDQVQYLNQQSNWVTNPYNTGGSVGPYWDCKDIGITTTTGFTVRWNAGRGLWQAVFVDYFHDPAHVQAMLCQPNIGGPLGPWQAPKPIYKFPEFTPGDPLFRPDPTDPTGQRVEPGVFCYGTLEIPAFSSNPTGEIKFIYCNSRNDLSDTAYYRLKTVAVPNPL